MDERQDIEPKDKNIAQLMVKLTTVQAQIKLVKAAIFMNKQRAAIAKKMKNVNENYIEAYILGAKAAYEMKDLDKAKEYAQDAISLDMNCAAGYYYLALVRFDEADCDEAVECMKRAIMHDLNNPAYYAKMSEIYKVNGNLQAALEYIKEAESIDNSTEYKIMYSELVSLNRKSKKLNNI